MKEHIRGIFDRVNNLVWEYRLGISTRGKGVMNVADEERIYYGTIHYPTIRAVLGHLRLSRNDVFVDLGCGKGRVVCCAALHEVRNVVGIEVSQELASQAHRNSQQLRGRKSPIKIVHASVEDFDYSQGSVFYMFHPFGPRTLQTVVTKLRQLHQRRDQEVRMAYVWPMHDAVLREERWLEEIDRWEPDHPSARGHLISFWKSR